MMSMVREEKKNLMGPVNMGLMFAPNIFRKPKDFSEESSMAMVGIMR